MSVEKSTANQTPGNVTNTPHDYSAKATAIYDASWQLAMTVEYYFQYVLIAIGIFGTAANALVLYALVSHNAGHAKKRAINLLIINQNVLDLTCCILLVITFSVRLNSIYFTGTLGYLLCTILTSETANYCAMKASCFNLMSLTVERYLNVVYPTWSKKKIKRWMIHAAMVFAWVGGFASMGPLAFVTTIVQDGMCLPYFIWISQTAKIIYAYWSLVTFIVIPTFIFIYCYGRIVMVIKKQMRVMAGHNNSAQENVSQIKLKRNKWNVIKTMIIISVVFVITWLPIMTYFMIVDNTAQSEPDMFVGYYATVFLSYLNVCMNPFIYALKHEGVKEKLISMMPGCFRRNVVMATVGALNINRKFETAAV